MVKEREVLARKKMSKGIGMGMSWGWGKMGYCGPEEAAHWEEMGSNDGPV